MNDRSSGRRRGLAILVAVTCAPLALPVAAESDSTGTVLDNAPAPVRDVVGQAEQQLRTLGAPPAAAPPSRQAPQSGSGASPKRAAPARRAHSTPPRPAAPSGAGGQSPQGSPAGTGGNSGSVTTGRAASTPSASSDGDDAAKPRAAAADTAGNDASQAAAPPPTELDENPSNDSARTLPFTGSRPLSLVLLGLLAFAIGAGVRWAVRTRFAAG